SSPAHNLDIIGNLRATGNIYPGNTNTNIKITSGTWDGGELKLHSSKHITAAVGENYGTAAFRVTKLDGGEILSVNLSSYQTNNTVLKFPNLLTVRLADDSGSSEFRVTKLNGTEMMSVNSNGELRAWKVIVQNGWADYVFDEDYYLMPLSEVEKFI